MNSFHIQQCMKWVPVVDFRSRRTEQSTLADKCMPVVRNRNTSDIHSPSRGLHIHNFHSQISVSTGKTLLGWDVETRIAYLHHGCSPAHDSFDLAAVVHMALVGTRRSSVHRMICIAFDRFGSRSGYFQLARVDLKWPKLRWLRESRTFSFLNGFTLITDASVDVLKAL